MRRPLYGGAVGIRSRQQDAVDKLRIFAKSDFMHDFGEGVPDRDKYTDKDKERFLEIARSYGLTKAKQMKDQFETVVDSNPYNLLKTVLASKIYPSVGDDLDFRNESLVLNTIGIDYGSPKPESLKNQFRKKIQESKAKKTYPHAPLKINDITVTIPGGEKRVYEVTAIPMKDDTTKDAANVASRFEAVTGGKTDFAIIVDASGGLSMTSILNTDLKPLPVNKCNFYIIENIENQSDSATKLKSFDKPKDQNPERLAKQPTLSFLRDSENTVLYPEFKLDVAKTDGEALFGNANLVLSRANEDTEADFTFADGKYHIENVSQNGNVKNASLNILAAALAHGGSIDKTGALSFPDKDKTPFLFPYIKRVGDWCQALSLLDTTRKYKRLDQNHIVTKDTVTLDSLRKSGAVISLLTLDRILLGYALSLGIDVFFTTATDLRLLIYFKNKEEQLSDVEIVKRAGLYKSEYVAMKKAVGGDKVAEILVQAAKNVEVAKKSDTDYIRTLRSVLYQTSTLRNEFASLNESLATIDAQIKQAEARKNTKELYRLYFEANVILKKLREDASYNEQRRAELNTYPTIEEDTETYNIVSGDRPSRTAFAGLKNIISKDMYNDVIQAKVIFERYGKREELKKMFTNSPKNPKFVDVFQAFSEIRTMVGVSLKGGGPEDILALQQFVVTPVATEKAYNELANQDPLPDIPLPLVVNTYYRDKKSFPYTVVDKFIITKENLPTFSRLSRHPIAPEHQAFVASRFMLLYIDILQSRIEKILASEDEDITLKSPDSDEPDYDKSEESDVKFANHKRVYYHAVKLLDTFTTFLQKKDWTNAFQTAFKNFTDIESLDNETINELAVGRDGLRNTNDHSKTVEKIKTVRINIANTVKSLEPPAVVQPNVQAPPAPSGGNDNDSGLRKRSRTRRITRVRQSTRKSKTR